MDKKKRFAFIAMASLIALSFAEPRPVGMETIPDEDYTLVFSDEFNLPNGSQPDSTKWSRCQRYNSLWNRWVSDSKDVVYIKNGCLVCRAIPNKTEKRDTAKMLTGAIWTKEKYAFKYGRVEVRMKTNLDEGNFPAAWMGRLRKGNKPVPYGEIDIVEMFGRKNESNHNIHTELTVNNPRHAQQNSFRHKVDVTKWHVYGVEWTPEYVMWTVDGKAVGVYRKSDKKRLLAQHQWTFDDYYYILLNQSVGHCAHGMRQNVKNVYETRFDWIRVYQKK